MAQDVNKWLESALYHLTGEYNIGTNGVPIFPKISSLDCHISYGFSSKGNTVKKLDLESVNKHGKSQLWVNKKTGKVAIFLNPILFFPGNEVNVLARLCHELIHLSIGDFKGHKNGFKGAMKQIGLDGKPLAHVPGDKFIKHVSSYNLPPMPVLPLVKSDAKKPGSRLVKCICGCGRIIRVSKTAYTQGKINCGLCNTFFLPEHLQAVVVESKTFTIPEEKPGHIAISKTVYTQGKINGT